MWIVDGDWVRANLNPDFTNFGQHFRFNFIPKYEWWVDTEASSGELKYYIDHLKVEYNEMSRGASYRDALDKADRLEKSERSKRININNSIKSPQYLAKIAKVKYLFSLGNVKVFIVDGEFVREVFDIDFTEGGNSKAYSWIPQNEIWVDNDVDKKEQRFVIIHEYTEVMLMNRGYSYPDAHQVALKAEIDARHTMGHLIDSVTSGSSIPKIIDEITTSGSLGTLLPMPMVVYDKKDGTTKPGYPYVKSVFKINKVREDSSGSGDKSDYHTGPWTFGVGGAKRDGFYRSVKAGTVGAFTAPQQAPDTWPLKWFKDSKKVNLAYNKETD